MCIMVSVVHLPSMVNPTDAIDWGVRVHLTKSGASGHAIGCVDMEIVNCVNQ